MKHEHTTEKLLLCFDFTIHYFTICLFFSWHFLLGIEYAINVKWDLYYHRGFNWRPSDNKVDTLSSIGVTYHLD